MTSRSQRAQIAAETLDIISRGSYRVDVSIADAIKRMKAGTVLYRPDDLNALLEGLDSPPQRETKVTVTNRTTFAAAREMIADGVAHPLCLNFASAKSPGGGFRTGAQAQEECLARASGLYESLVQRMDYYEANRGFGSSLYTNHMIYSPGVPVFRSDDDQLIADPYQVAIVTSPAVNAGAVRKNETDKVARIESTMKHRIESLLAVARRHGHTSLVLGAWGCGVFKNDPAQVAGWFAESLFGDTRFKGAFERIDFAVLDFAEGTPTYAAFQREFERRAAVAQASSLR